MDGELPQVNPQLRAVSEDCAGHVRRRLCLLHDTIFPLTLRFLSESSLSRIFMEPSFCVLMVEFMEI